MTVLKPYFILIYPVFFLSVWFILRRDTKEQAVFASLLSNTYKIILLGLPLMILLSPWIVRNFVVLGKFIPAQEDVYAGYNYSKAHLAFVDFVSSWGGSSVYWDPQDAGCYFLIDEGKPCEYVIPDYALTDGYSREEVESVRLEFIKLQENYSPELNESVVVEFERLTKIFRQEQPFRYHIGARFSYFKKLFFVFQ